MEILKPAKISDMPIKNRLIMAPLTRSRADNSEAAPTDLHVEYYKQRASAGLIISEGTVVSKQGVGYVNVPGIYSEKQVEAWRKVTEAVHENGGKIFMQIWHVGRISHPDFLDGELPVAPSAINPNISIRTPKGKEESVTPKALTIEEIQGIVEDFKNAGKNAMTAGFDGVEIHSSNGYLFRECELSWLESGLLHFDFDTFTLRFLHFQLSHMLSMFAMCTATSRRSCFYLPPLIFPNVHLTIFL